MLRTIEAHTVLHLDYGSVSTPINVMQCVKVCNGAGVDGGTNYMRDNDGFLVVNFNELVVDTEA